MSWVTRRVRFGLYIIEHKTPGGPEEGSYFCTNTPVEGQILTDLLNKHAPDGFCTTVEKQYPDDIKATLDNEEIKA